MRYLITISVLLLHTALARDISDMYYKAVKAQSAGDVAEAERFLDAATVDVKNGKAHSIDFALRFVQQYSKIGRSDKASSLYQWALEASRDQGNFDQTEELLLWKGTMQWKEGHYVEAGASLRELLALIETHTGDACRYRQGLALGQLAQVEDALGHVKEAEDLFRREGIVSGVCHHCPPCAACDDFSPPDTIRNTYPYDFASFYIGHGHPEKAEELYRRLVDESSHRSAIEKYAALGDLGSFLHWCNRLDESALIEEAQIATLYASPDQRQCALALRSNAIEWQIQAGKLAAAEASIEKAVSEARNFNGTASETYVGALLLHVRLGLSQRDCATAKKALDQCRMAAVLSKSGEARGYFNRYRLEVVSACRTAVRVDLAKKLIDEHLTDMVQWYGKGTRAYIEELDRFLFSTMAERDYATAGKWVDDYINIARSRGDQSRIEMGLRWKSELSALSKP